MLDGGVIAVLWDRNGDLQPGSRLSAPSPADADRLGQWRFALADADGDGRLDVVSWVSGSSYYGLPSYVVLHRNAGERRFTTEVAATFHDYLGSNVAAADFDGDGDVDLVANGAEDRLNMLVNRGDGRHAGCRCGRRWTARPGHDDRVRLRRSGTAGLPLGAAEPRRLLFLGHSAPGDTARTDRDRRWKAVTAVPTTWSRIAAS